LLVMSHYDSAAYASHGAADAGSGIAVILEGIRSYLRQNIKPKNDIIILFSDAEEIGLMGARGFVNKHKWAQNIGVVLNFEARGSSGSSFMIMETNHGNRNLLASYNSAAIAYPNSSSLAYSIYKLLPNDTDLTVFRENKDIIGFNFAFIDDHFNYHTELDTVENISLDSLAQQAYYLMPLLNKFSQMDLETLQSEQDDVYFQIPFWKTIVYPFSWTFMLSSINLVLFALALTLGIRNKSLRIKPVLLGSLPLIKALTTTALISFAMLKFLYWLHPHYSEILQGFPYNGHAYIVFFSLVSASICFWFYTNNKNNQSAAELMIAPILLWILVSFIFTNTLKGMHFFTLISLTGTLVLLLHVVFKKEFPNLSLLLFLPVIAIFSPVFFVQLPVALGMMILPFSGLLIVSVLSLFIKSIQINKQWPIHKWLIISVLLGSYIFAETQASFNQSRPLPNSLYYFQDNESKKAYWFTHDYKLDKWSIQILTDNNLSAQELSDFQKQQWYWAKIVSNTDYKDIPVATIEVLKDRKYSDKRLVQFKITPRREVNRLNLVLNSELTVFKFSINGETHKSQNALNYPAKSTLSRIQYSGESEFIVDLEIALEDNIDFSLIEISPNLLQSNYFDIPPRTEELITKPFVYSDSLISKQRIHF